MMSGIEGRVLLAAVCDFGWGSLGKFRLILDRLGPTTVTLYGSAPINTVAADLLGSHHRFVERPPNAADVALVINDPIAANRIGSSGVPVVYVDSLPYLWATRDEVPAKEAVAYYCAQKYPRERLPLAPPLKGRRIQWIDPIVPRAAHRPGGRGTVINVGGLHSHLAGNAVQAYLRLVVIPLAEELKASGRPVAGICGNLPADVQDRLRAILPDCPVIGQQSPYEFEALLKTADWLLTSPGSTTILQAVSLGIPTLLLPPQNLSQMLNSRLYSSSGTSNLRWPENLVSDVAVERLRSNGEDAVLAYLYAAISGAAASPQASQEVSRLVRTALGQLPPEGMLDLSLARLGRKGASQVAQLIKQSILAPLRI